MAAKEREKEDYLEDYFKSQKEFRRKHRGVIAFVKAWPVLNVILLLTIFYPYFALSVANVMLVFIYVYLWQLYYQLFSNVYIGNQHAEFLDYTNEIARIFSQKKQTLRAVLRFDLRESLVTFRTFVWQQRKKFLMFVALWVIGSYMRFQQAVMLMMFDKIDQLTDKGFSLLKSQKGLLKNKILWIVVGVFLFYFLFKKCVKYLKNDAKKVTIEINSYKHKLLLTTFWINYFLMLTFYMIAAYAAGLGKIKAGVVIFVIALIFFRAPRFSNFKFVDKQ
jgi:hypothetical protein